MESIFFCNKEMNYDTKRSFLFQNLSTYKLESCRLPTLVNTKKAIWRNLLSTQTDAISLVVMSSNELWLVQENHVTVKLYSSVASRGMKTYSQSRIYWTAKSTNFEENSWKVLSVFVIGAALWAENVGRCLDYSGSSKICVRLRSTLEATRFKSLT